MTSLRRSSRRNNKNKYSSSRPTRLPSPFVDLPNEIKFRIASNLDPHEGGAVARTCKAWQDAGESAAWRSVYMDYLPGRCFCCSGLTECTAPEYVKLLERLEISTTSRSRRLQHIRDLGLAVPEGKKETVINIVKSVSSHLKEISVKMNRYQTAEIVTSVIEAAGPFNKLSELYANFERTPCGWVRDAVDMINHMPALEKLAWEGYMGWISATAGTGDTEKYKLLEVQLRPLLHLRHVSINDQHGLISAGTIFDQAPNVTFLHASCETQSSMGEAEDKLLIDKELVCLGKIISHNSLRHFELYLEDKRYGPQTLAIMDNNWCPNIISLSISAAWGPQSFAPHPSIEYLGIVNNLKSPSAYHAGSLPSGEATGLLAPWIVSGLTEMPRLVRLDRQNGFDLEGYRQQGLGQWWTHEHGGAFAFRTYGSGNGMLIHARIHVCPKLYYKLLCDHDLTYSHGEMTYEVNGNHPVEEEDDADPEEYSDGEKQPVWIDLTSYHGWPLPFCLLDYVYSAIGEHRDWKDGARGLQLPDEVWEVLEGWKDMIEAEK